MNSKALSTQINALKSQGIGGSTLGSLEISLANKLAWPFACVIGMVLAVPLAIRYGKRGRTLGIAMAIFSFFIYFLLMSAAAAFGRNDAMNPTLAAWIPNIIMGGVGLVLFFLEDR